MKTADVQSYLNQLEEPFAGMIKTLHRQICTWQPDLEVKLLQSARQSMISYNQPRHLLGDKAGNEFVVGLAALQKYCSLYLVAKVGQQTILETYRDQLGDVGIGRSCLNFTSLAELKLDVIEEMIQQAVQFAASPSK